MNVISSIHKDIKKVYTAIWNMLYKVFNIYADSKCFYL